MTRLGAVMTRLGAVMLVCVTAILLFILANLALDVLDQPVVQMSNRTGKCVQIIYKGMAYECVPLDDTSKYSVEGVK